MITEGESEGVLITSITTPVNNAYVRNGDIVVAGNSDVNFPIVLRMFSGNDEVAAETITPKNGRWDTVIKGVFRPGQYRLELQPVGGVKVTVNLRVTPVTIISPVSGEEVDEQFSIRGAGGEYGVGTVRVHNASTGGVLGNADIQPDGTWEKRLTLLGNSASYFATQVIGEFPSPSSATINVTSKSTPIITSPIEPLQNCSFSIGGTQGRPGSVMQIFKDLSTIQVGEDAVSAANWFVPVIVEPGPVSLVAMQTLGGVPSKRSAPRSFRIRPPKLAEPDVTFLPDTSLKFSGSGHFDQNLSTEIQFSASDSSLPLPPNVRVNAQGQWEAAPIVWPLGSYDVTVIQKIADNASGWIESQPLEFKVRNDMPDITEASYTEDYLPVFSGKGYTGATVSLRFPDTTEAARNVLVVNGQWSTPALVEWGPTSKREVRITQHLGNHPSQRPFILYVTIPPLAPGVDDPGEEGLEPVFRGTCLSGATVSIRFNDDTETHVATVTGATWTFQRPTPFEANIEHTVEVTQTILDLPSKPASKTFTVHRVMLQPLIVAPGSGSEVGYDVTIEGDNGMQGAVMQLHDSQMGGELGAPLELLEEGKWSIELHGLELRNYFLHAQQTLNGQESTNSAEHLLKVVVPPPRFTSPIPGGKAPRTSKIAGTGIPRAWVEVCSEDVTGPLLTIEVSASGNWEGEVILKVGNKAIWAFQTLVLNGIPQRSQPNERLRYKVVPAAPFIETPTADDHVGRRVVVSGFATPGDTVTVTLGSDQASAEVRDNRTWSVTLEPGQGEGNHELDAVAADEGFASDSAKRTVQLATYLPTIEIPAPGRWVSNPVLFAGKGRQGVGVLVDPFNPDKIWKTEIPVDPDWQGLSDQALPLGGNWCRFKLQPSDSDPMGSDWVVSERFEVESAPTDKTRL
jgi:hypothetical protein